MARATQWALAVVLLCGAVAARAGTVERAFRLSGVNWHQGARAVQLALDGLDGIKAVRVLVAAKRLEVTYDPQRISADAIEQAVRRAPATGESGDYDAAPVAAATPSP